jgi:hypothetical protein
VPLRAGAAFVMFRLIRLVILVMLAFVIGVFFERNNMRQSCTAMGGSFDANLCVIAAQ